MPSPHAIPPAPTQQRATNEFPDSLRSLTPASIGSWLILAAAIIWIPDALMHSDGQWWLSVCAFLLARILVAIQQTRSIPAEPDRA